MDNKVILITGASSGIGKACMEYLTEKGCKVYGTTRRIELIEKAGKNSKAKLVRLDVTDRASITEAVNGILEKEGKIDILINNAGMGMAGSLEDTSYEEAKLQFDTNFFGALNVINEVLPHMRNRKEGLIINIGSVAGYIAIPYQAIYSATKAAVTSATLSLRNEIKQFGIKACVVHPGDLKTNFTKNRKKTEKSKGDTVYKKKMEHSIAVMAHDEQNGGDPVVIAKAIYRILKKKNPPVALTVGLKYKAIAVLFRIIPAKLREYIVALIYA